MLLIHKRRVYSDVVICSEIYQILVRSVFRTNENKDVVVNQTMMPFSAGYIINLMMAVR